MKEAAKSLNKQDKKRIHKALYSIQDGWNFGIGFWLSFIALPFLLSFIGLVFYFIAWALMILLG